LNKLEVLTKRTTSLALTSRSKLFSERLRFAVFANNAQFYDLIMVKRINIFETWKNL